MWRCPICGKEHAQGTFCDSCGFDSSCNYEQERTLCSALPKHIKPISVRAEKWRQQQEPAIAVSLDNLSCPECGGTHFLFLADELQFMCTDCKTKMPVTIQKLATNKERKEEEIPAPEPPLPIDEEPPIEGERTGPTDCPTSPPGSSRAEEPPSQAASENPDPPKREEDTDNICPWCKGTGREVCIQEESPKKAVKGYWGSTWPCKTCGGTGRVSPEDAVDIRIKINFRRRDAPLPAGKKIDPSCPCCDGRGLVRGRMPPRMGIENESPTVWRPCPRCSGNAVEFPTAVRKSKAVTLLLFFTIGWLTGAHCFYEGRTKTGLRYLTTMLLGSYLYYMSLPYDMSIPLGIVVVVSCFAISGSLLSELAIVLLRGKHSYLLVKGKEIYNWDRTK